MRLKQVWSVIPIPAKGKLFWERITFSRITSIYFAFSALHCIIQIVFQVQAFTINERAADFLWHLVTQANAKDPGFAVRKGEELRFCESVPSDFSTDSCDLIWSAAGLYPSAAMEDTSNNSSNGSQSGRGSSSSSSRDDLSTSASGAAAQTRPLSSVTSTASSTDPSITSASKEAESDSDSVSDGEESDDELSDDEEDAFTSAPVISAQASSTFSVVSSSSTISSAVSSTSSVSSPASPAVASANALEEEGDDELESVSGDESDSDSDSDDAESVSSDEDEEEFERRELSFTADELAALDIEELQKRDDSNIIITAVEVNGTTEVLLDGFGFDHKTLQLSRRCLYTLNWPVEELNNTKREDITFIAFQLWVFGMSVVALLNESIPHIIASLLTHVLATGWGAFQIIDTARFRSEFNQMTKDSSCGGVNLLPSYWSARANAEIPSLALNAVALLVSAFLSWKLFKLFGWQTFKRVGASRSINRMYKLVLFLSIAIQLSLFFILVSVALWIDSLCNGQIGRMSDKMSLYKGVMITVILLLIPWLATGWIAVRRELRIPMAVFLVLSFGYSAGWGAMFASPTFRWTFVLWQFFGTMTVASVVLTLSTFILGLWCRINFGKGLPRYLNAEEPLPDEFVPVAYDQRSTSTGEKVDFPTGRGALPTFSAAFGKDTPPSQMKFTSPRLGPRFTSPSLEPFETPSEGRSVISSISTMPSTYHNVSTIHTFPTIPTDAQQHSRSGSIGSQRSYSSYKSSSSTSSGGRSGKSEPNPFSKKWAIE